MSKIKKSWFILELYTPTPNEFTNNTEYVNKSVDKNYINNKANTSYRKEDSNYTFINKTEVIHIEC